MGRCKFGYHKAIKRSGYPPSFWKNLSSQNKKKCHQCEKSKTWLAEYFLEIIFGSKEISFWKDLFIETYGLRLLWIHWKWSTFPFAALNASSFFLFTEKARLEVKVEVQQPIKQTSFYLNPKFVLNSNQPWSLVGKINCIQSTKKHFFISF